MPPQVQDNMLDSNSLGGPGNFPVPAGFSMGIFAAFFLQDIFEDGSDRINVGGCLLDSDLNLVTLNSSTKLTITADVVENQGLWYQNFVQMDLMLRTDDMTHSYGRVALVGDNSTYTFFNGFVGTRVAQSTPAFARTYTVFAGQTLADLKQIYPVAVIEIIEMYGTDLGFFSHGDIGKNGKLFLHTCAYNTQDFVTGSIPYHRYPLS